MLNSSLRSSATRRLATSRASSVRTQNARAVRWNSTTTSSSPSVSQNVSGNGLGYALAGAAGGGIVLLGGYSYYHFSGAKKLVDSAKGLKASAVSAKNTFVEKTPSPNEALAYLRSFSKSYVALIPGASGYVDKTFDSIDEIAETHGEEVNEIVGKANQELQEAVKGGQLDLPTAQKVFEILRKRGEQLTSLAASASGGAIQKLLDEHPEVKEKFGGGWGELKGLAERSGAPEAKKLADETTKQVVAIFKDGFSPDAILKARNLVKEKSQELRKIADKASKEAYDKALETAKPYLDKSPDLKSLLESNASVLSSAGAASSAGAIWSALKSAGGKGKFNGEELTKVVKEKIDEAKKAAEGTVDEATGGEGGEAWKGIQSYLEGAIPGAKDIPDLSALIAAAKDNSEDAQKLAQETYDEVLEVLKAKAEEAKKLAEGAKEDVKEGSSKSDSDSKSSDSRKGDSDSKNDSKKEKKDDKKRN